MYIIRDLDRKIIIKVPSIFKAAQFLKVSEETVSKRIKNKVDKDTLFRGDKYKFNVEKINETK